MPVENAVPEIGGGMSGGQAEFSGEATRVTPIRDPVPIITVGPENLTLTAGDSALLQCEILHQLIVKWLKGIS